MKKLVIYCLPVLIAACTSTHTQPEVPHPELQSFNALLGEEYVLAYDAAVASFHRFLHTHYPEGENLSDQTALFLEDYFWNPRPRAKWKFNPLADSLVLLRLEASGLRKEFYLYGHELESHSPRYNLYKYLYQQEPDPQDADTISFEGVEEIIIPEPEVDSSYTAEMRLQEKGLLTFNTHGKYLFALAGAIHRGGAPADSAVLEYIIAKERMGKISPVVVVDGLRATFSENRFDDPLLHRILVMEFYYDILRWRFAHSN